MKKPSKPIRILHIVTIMDRAGLETMLMNYYRHIDRTKIQFDFLVHRTEKGAYDDEIKELGGKIYYAPAINLKNIITYIRKMTTFFIEHPEYDIVHSHLDALSALPLAAAKKAGIKNRIAHSHVNGFDHDSKVIVRMFLRMFIPHYATDLFACSDEAGRFMFGKKNDFKVMRNAFDLEKFKFNPRIRAALRRSMSIDKKFVVGNIGRFSYPKNHSFLIKVFYELLEKHPEAILMLVGDGELRGEIEHEVHELGIDDKVLFLGVRDDIHDLVQAMDVFVMPSHYEGLGIAVLEASASNVPVVVNRDAMSADILKRLDGRQMSLKKSSGEWAEYISSIDVQSSRLRPRNFSDTDDYDIISQSKILHKLYLSMLEEIQSGS